jgi:regulator of RNase E activity RraB
MFHHGHSDAFEKARIEAHKQGYTVTEQLLADGSIKLSVLVEG